jgi:multiple sugar transport system permease protein/raffinose/stachyose/melibiose transport system permease protein
MSKFKLANIIAYGFVTLFSIYILLPILVMLLTTFKTRKEIFLEPLGLPGQFNFSSFEKALQVGLGGFMFNSFLVSLFSVFLIVMISGMAAYVLARIDFKINKFVYLLIVAGFAIPPAAVLVPLYATVSNLGLLNSIFGVVMPLTAFGIPFTVILFFAFFLDFPREVEEAATIDGCSKLQIFFKIIIPLSGPAIASAAIFQTVWIWNEFLLALIMLTSDDVRTLPLGLLRLRGEWTSDWPAIMAGLTIAIIPVLIVFLIFQKYFVRSLAGLGK